MHEAELRNELLRARDRLHDIEGNQAVQGELLRQLDKRIERCEERVMLVEEIAHNLVDADRLANAVSARVNADSATQFTTLQSWGIRVGIVAALVAAIAQLVQLSGVIG